VLKNKKTPVTTASRKPLFLEKRDNKNSTLKALKINQNQNQTFDFKDFFFGLCTREPVL